MLYWTSGLVTKCRLLLDRRHSSSLVLRLEVLYERDMAGHMRR